MKKLRLLMLLGLAACGSPNQIGQPHLKPVPPTRRFANQQAEARIEKLTRSELVLERRGKPFHIKFADDTEVRVGGVLVTRDDLKVGDQVRVTYDAIEAPARARKVEILTADGGR